MTHKVSPVTGYPFCPEDELLLDANIWMFVYGPRKPGDTRAAIYSQALAKILAAHSRIYMDVLIVSEFINTYARLQWRLLAPHIRQFKDFRQSTAFKPVAQDIAADTRRILKLCSRTETGFELVEINAIMDAYAAGDADFNDQMLTALCKRKGLTLVTDDSDFGGQDIPIVTANKRLLGAVYGAA